MDRDDDERSGILYMYSLAGGSLVAGLLAVFAFPDGGRTRLGLGAHGIGWIVIGSAIFTAVAAYREPRK